MKKFLLLTLFLALLSSTLFAQIESTEKPRKAGLMAMVQSSQFDIGLPVWTSSQSTIIGPSLSITYLEDVSTDVGLGVFLKNYGSGVPDEIGVFTSLRGGTIIGKPDGGDTTFDFILGVGFGVDYFPHEKVSLGIEAQLNATKNDEGSGRFGRPGAVSANTAAVIALSIFF